jgi:hypothetical protein
MFESAALHILDCLALPPHGVDSLAMPEAVVDILFNSNIENRVIVTGY